MIDEQNKKVVLEKYFQKVDKNMCMNKEMIQMENDFFEVADIVSKQFLYYILIEKDLNLGKIWELLKPRWEKFGVTCAKEWFPKLLKNVYLKNRFRNAAKFAVLSVVMDVAFNCKENDELFKLIVGRMYGDDKTRLLKVMNKMQQHFDDFGPHDEFNSYIDDNTPPKAPKKIPKEKMPVYIQGKVKNVLQKGYDKNGTYEWDEHEHLWGDGWADMREKN
jgi:hypothetical protein